MVGGWVTKLAVMLLRNSRLSNENRQLLTTVLLGRLGALPLHATITFDSAGQIFVNKKQPDLETSKRLYETSKSMLNNFARRFVREQVLFMAVKMGVHENISPEQGLFAKAAIWFYQEEEELYRKLAQLEGVEDA